MTLSSLINIHTDINKIVTVLNLNSSILIEDQCVSHNLSIQFFMQPPDITNE